MRKEATRLEIGDLDANRILNTSVDTLCEYYEAQHSVDVPQLNRAQVTIESRETRRVVNDYGRKVEVPSTEIAVTVPFEGPSEAFSIQPTTYSSMPVSAIVADRELVFNVSAYGKNEQQLKAEIEKTIQQIENQLAALSNNVEASNNELRPLIRTWIEQRRGKLLADQNLVASLGYKIKQRPGVAQTYVTPAVRRKIAPSLPPPTTTPFSPEPVLANDDYDQILGMLHNMALVMERSPSAFKELGEEELRFLFLVPLNGIYEGAATGEVFNYEGKTDILIRDKGRNIFVAECKFWSGPKKLTETIDQLLGYTCWRDTKTAIVLFNKNKDFSKVLEAILGVMGAHPNHVRFVRKVGETRFQYTFSHRDDAKRELTLTVLAFDVPRS
jgi:hypothetical protein